MSAQKLTIRREDVAALEDAGDTLERNGEHDRAVTVWALALRLSTEAGWNPLAPEGYSWRVPSTGRVPSNVVELHRGE